MARARWLRQDSYDMKMVTLAAQAVVGAKATQSRIADGGRVIGAWLPEANRVGCVAASQGVESNSRVRRWAGQSGVVGASARSGGMQRSSTW